MGEQRIEEFLVDEPERGHASIGPESGAPTAKHRSVHQSGFHSDKYLGGPQAWPIP